MGVRIVVVLQQDLAHLWSQDTELGKKILSQVYGVSDMPTAEIEGGKVVEVLDDCVQSLVAFDRYEVHKLAYTRTGAGIPVAVCAALLRGHVCSRRLG